MARVTEIGGFFFRATDRTAIVQWYAQHLGMMIGDTPWVQDAGETMLSPFAADTDYFGRDSQQWMLNLRVEGLRAMIDTLRADGIAVETRAEWDGDYGLFARIHDPEGNPIELWEPPSTR